MSPSEPLQQTAAATLASALGSRGDHETSCRATDEFFGLNVRLSQHGPNLFALAGMVLSGPQAIEFPVPFLEWVGGDFDDLLLLLAQAEEFGVIADLPAGRLRGRSLHGIHAYPSLYR
jgi:hypothetical protein